MHVEHRTPLDELAVLSVLNGAVELNPPRLGRFVTGYYTYYNSRWHVRLPGSLQCYYLALLLLRARANPGRGDDLPQCLFLLDQCGQAAESARPGP